MVGPDQRRHPGDRVVLGPDPLALAGGAPAHADLASLSRAVAQGAPVPEYVLATCLSDAPGPAVSARAAVHRVLELAQAFLAEPTLTASRLVIVTRNAVATGPDADVTDLAHAAVWGLVRSAQSEHPDRFLLVDVDGTPRSHRALPDVLTTTEPQLAVRAGAPLVPGSSGPRHPRALGCAGPQRDGPRDRRHRRAGRPGLPTPGRRARRPPPAAGQP
ncbi:hypothetical protein NKG94_03815 [Micromonospora sp. M12]